MGAELLDTSTPGEVAHRAGLAWLLASGLTMKVSRPPFSLASALSMAWGRLMVAGVNVYSLSTCSST